MKITHFTLLKIVGKGPLDWIAIAQIKVETGILWWRKTAIKEITCPYGRYWRFSDTGHYTPGQAVESMVRSLEAFTRRELWKIVPIQAEKGEGR